MNPERIPQIDLRYFSKEKAEAAAEALNTAVRALRTHADVFVATPVTLVSNPTGQPEDPPYQVKASFGAASPREPDRPTLRPAELTLSADNVVPSRFLHTMLDLETWGRAPGCALRSIGACFMGPAGVTSRFYVNVDLLSQQALGLVVEPATEQWWSEQSAAARAAFVDPSTMRPLRAALEEFSEWMNTAYGSPGVRVWGNGSDFDNAILAAAYEAAEVTRPWQFYNNRCFRTLKNLLPLPSGVGRPVPKVAHNALADAEAQAEHAILLLNAHNLWRTV
jgi:hypothetical protein